jgi:hypothetical protein
MDIEARIDRLEDALTRLAEAQARTEERVGALEERAGRLEEALIRLTERVDRLAEAQARTEQRLEALAQAQARTERALLALTQQVGRLAETIGFTLEDLAREVTPAYLAQHHGIEVARLDRRFFVVDGDEVEVDPYGEGTRAGMAVVVVGEVRSRIYGRDVEATRRQADRLAPQLPAPPVVVLFGFVIHPSARDAARRLEALVISSSGR